MITLIAATDRNNLIGDNGKLPWKVPEDMAFFKKITSGNIVVLGRKTYISIGKPLTNRINVLISESILKTLDTSKPLSDYENDIVVINSFEDMLNPYFNCEKDIFIIGGRSIYRQSLEKSIPEKLLISRIDDEYEGNEYFPEIPKNYKLVQKFRISPRILVDEYRRIK